MLKNAILFTAIFLTSVAFATKWPNRYFNVHGKVLDFETKSPLSNAVVFVFLNNSPYADNNGSISKDESAEVSKTNRDGNFNTKAILFAGKELPLKLNVELIIAKEGYRTERFTYDIIDFIAPININSRGTIQGLQAELLKVKKQ